MNTSPEIGPPATIRDVEDLELPGARSLGAVVENAVPGVLAGVDQIAGCVEARVDLARAEQTPTTE